jgi:hypothetical protein
MSQTLTRRRALEGLVHAGAGFAFRGGWLSALLGRAHALALQPRETGDASWNPRFFSAPEAAAIVSLVELIIPSTESPGAREAKAHQFIDAVLAEAEPAVQTPFRAGLERLRARGPLDQALHALSDRVDALTIGVRIDRHLDARFVALPELNVEGLSPEEIAQLEFFVGLKTMTLSAYLTSDLVSEQFFHGDYAGCAHKEHR